ncbi:cellulase family glycosylhydrolase [Lichenifustis flavocetrariae]|uniref:Glycoside hydrolase family 5 protein n=1 Tax=Lichenifustis flavocetrariae TaxID=2949735 RepID=A0AA41YYK0_9HYPH|nr:cellulase family glycosylhydrolase [Lichenifustis flavocetrariae]MCW6510956.1 glycoside hydrolase family 5 protein [Lichenifustis flavocetrariae]
MQDAAWGTFNQPGWTGNNGDPLNNFAFEGHAYLDSNNSGIRDDVQGGNASFGSTIMVDMTNWCRYTNGNTSTPKANPFKAFVGEFGWTTSTLPMQAGTNQLDYLSANSDVWIGWTWYLGGNFASQANYTYGSVVPSGSVGYYTDRPQLAQLTAHL